ncbi:putative addiction module antidote [Rhodovulum bhavnagarense]|uniref:Putative addiction module antidote n=1 Tax=Rhodovulum bhavnagarense TaxID=992286 RepID=A0A4R2REY6_9RHOB|nr:AbrB/MazE/SpoVT family DNA-binding domain-containing protein [Rhodovulum bhavnagarense]TCP61423.1 putative addiction module antidote [Rhodovulum bhavnagarense]
MPQIRKVGNSLGVTMSRETLAKANLGEGDEVILTPVQDGILVSAASSAQARMLAAAMADMDARPDTYRKLAE